MRWYLGAFGCDVFKAPVKNNIYLDIIGGTSKGGINSAIIADNKKSNGLKSEKVLEQFWLERVEDSPALNFPLSIWFAKNVTNHVVCTNTNVIICLHNT